MAKMLKKNLRAMRAADLVWLYMKKKDCAIATGAWSVNDEGCAVQLGNGRSLSIPWAKVAERIGVEECEVAYDPEGAPILLAYDMEVEDV